MQIIFLRPLYLWLLLSIVFLIIIHFFTVRGLKRKALAFANFEALERATGRALLSHNLLILFVMVAVFILFILSAAGMTIIVNTEASNFDYVLALDTSASMAAGDLLPNRLEVAKSAASGFVNASRDADFGLVSFSSTAFVEQTLTRDTNVIASKLSGIQVRKGGGTDLGEALVTSVNLLQESEDGKAVILLTDGRSNIGLPLQEAVGYAVENLVVVHTIAVGTSAGGQIEGTDVVLKLDENVLQDIAENTGGSYYEAENPEELSIAYQEIAAISLKNVSRDFSMYLLIAGLMLLTFLWGILNTQFRTLP